MPVMEKKVLTVRLPADQAEELEAVAQIDDVPVAEAVREAIGSHIAARRKDRDFRARLKASVERNRQILDRLGR